MEQGVNGTALQINIKYIIPSEGHINRLGQPLSYDLRYSIAGMKRRSTGNLPNCIELAIGRKAILSTDAKI